MARIAEGTCATCHTIRPKNEMREVAVSRRVGTRYGISHSRNGNRESASAQYRRQHVWVCRGCRAPKSDGLIPWKLLLLAAAVFAGYVWYTGQQGAVVRNVARTASPRTVERPTGAQFVDRDEPATERAEKPAADDSGMLGGIGSTIANAVSAPAAFDWDQDAIRTATIEALDRGKARKWKVDGAKGQSVPSAPTATADQGECRNVYQVATIDGKKQTSDTVAWCRQGSDGQWEQRR